MSLTPQIGDFKFIIKFKCLPISLVLKVKINGFVIHRNSFDTNCINAVTEQKKIPLKRFVSNILRITYL